MELTLYTGRPAVCSGREKKEIRVYDFLDHLGIQYMRVDHEHTDTMEACKGADEVLDILVCKNLFLCNRQPGIKKKVITLFAKKR